MKNTVVTIGREFGSGGRLIARKLADKLGVPFYDKELIKLAAKETGFSEEFVLETENRRTTSLLYNLYTTTQNLSLSDQVFIAESRIIRQIAEKGPCVIVGRCSDYVLRERSGCVHVFIHAPLEHRIKRAKEVYGVEAPDMKSYVTKMDKSRAAYYNYFSSNKWGKCQNYDLSINSEIGIDATVSVIAERVRQEDNI